MMAYPVEGPGKVGKGRVFCTLTQPKGKRLLITSLRWRQRSEGREKAPAGTSVRPDYQLGDGADHACGKEFPTCNGSFMPFGEARRGLGVPRQQEEEMVEARGIKSEGRRKLPEKRTQLLL